MPSAGKWRLLVKIVMPFSFISLAQILGVTTDILFPIQQQRDLTRLLKESGKLLLPLKLHVF